MPKNEPAPHENTPLQLLIVEDSPAKRAQLNTFFTLKGYAVDIASHGLAGIEKVKQAPHKYQAILMNITMPAVDGFEATQVIKKELGFQGPIIGFSVTSDEAMAQKAKACGMDDCVNYFIDNESILQVLQAALANTTT